MDLVVREARETELDRIGALTAEVYEGDGLAGPEYLEVLRDARARWESPATTLLVKFGALAFVLGLDATSAINFQLLGGVLILQTFPAIVGGLYTRYFHRWALLAGWAAGIVYGSVVAWQQSSATQHHFAGQVALIPWTHQKAYIAVTALAVNLLVLVVANFVLRAVKAPAGVDATSPADYDHDVEPDEPLEVVAPTG